MSSNLYIGSFNVHILINISASHSFVNLEVVLRLGLIVFSLQCSLLISGPKCDPSVIDMIYYICLVMVEDKCFTGDLVVLELMNFDVILGMDWLSANYATLNYRNKVVRFRGMDGLEVVFQGDQTLAVKGMISTMQANKML